MQPALALSTKLAKPILLKTYPCFEGMQGMDEIFLFFSVNLAFLRGEYSEK